MSDIKSKKLIEDVLEHHGIKGMKWGVRRAVDIAIGTKTAGRKPVSKPLTSKERAHNFKKKNPTAEQRTAAIAQARARVKIGKARISAQENSTKKAELNKALLNNPDRATALRLTRGQKIVAGLLVVTGIGAVPVAAIVGGRVAVRKHIERKQARGGYK